MAKSKIPLKQIGMVIVIAVVIYLIYRGVREGLDTDCVLTMPCYGTAVSTSPVDGSKPPSGTSVACATNFWNYFNKDGKWDPTLPTNDMPDSHAAQVDGRWYCPKKYNIKAPPAGTSDTDNALALCKMIADSSNCAAGFVNGAGPNDICTAAAKVGCAAVHGIDDKSCKPNYSNPPNCDQCVNGHPLGRDDKNNNAWTCW